MLRYVATFIKADGFDIEPPTRYDFDAIQQAVVDCDLRLTWYVWEIGMRPVCTMGIVAD